MAPLGFCEAAGAVEPAGETPWATTSHAAARLIAAGPGPDGAPRAAIEIRLDPGAITYWRDPGEAGLPPQLATDGSVNVAEAALAFPAPRRLDEGGVAAFGYAGDVVFPLRVTLADPARPATLSVALDYAVCTTLCLPASARLTLAVPREPLPDAGRLVEAAWAAVPRRVPLGAGGSLALERVAAAGETAVTVEARAAPGATLFAEGPEGWFLDVGTAEPAEAGTLRFPVTVAQRPDGARLAGTALRFTLVSGAEAIETTVKMDETAGRN